MNIREMSPELAEKARIELNENPQRIKEELGYIKEWLRKQPHLHARTDDQWLVAFLRGCKYSLEKVKTKIDFHYTIRNTAPDLFRITYKDRLFTEIFDLGCIIILPQTAGPVESRVAIIRPGTYDPAKYTVSDILSASNILQKIIIMEDDNAMVAGLRVVLDLEGVTLGHFVHMTVIQMKKLVISFRAMVILPNPAGPAEPVVTIYRPGVYDPQKYSVIEIMRCSMIVQKIILYENDNFVIAGVRSIMDMQNCTMAHFVQMTPSTMKKMSVYMQDAAPIRLKGSHYVNTIAGFETVFNLFKTFLNEKNRSRLFVHNKNFEEMYKYVSQEILPSEYGGKAGPIKNITEHWKQKVKEYWPWLQEDLQYGTDESKRPGKPKTAEDIFGVDGSFRQLQFD
ncbi:hypothetical protein ACJJTC_012226 [Scirpophaga incertulas]